jgi:hypothetical protein
MAGVRPDDRDDADCRIWHLSINRRGESTRRCLAYRHRAFTHSGGGDGDADSRHADANPALHPTRIAAAHRHLHHVDPERHCLLTTTTASTYEHTPGRLSRLARRALRLERRSRALAGNAYAGIEYELEPMSTH